MKNKLSTLIDLIKYLPKHYLEQAKESLENMKEKVEWEEYDDTLHCSSPLPERAACI